MFHVSCLFSLENRGKPTKPCEPGKPLSVFLEVTPQKLSQCNKTKNSFHSSGFSSALLRQNTHSKCFGSMNLGLSANSRSAQTVSLIVNKTASLYLLVRDTHLGLLHLSMNLSFFVSKGCCCFGLSGKKPKDLPDTNRHC